MNSTKLNVYQSKALITRARNARIDARLAAEFAQRQAALTAKLDAIVAANTEEAMDIMPENPADIFTPEEIGRMDFDEGLDADPTRHYAKLGDMDAYELGYRQGYREAEDTAEYEDDILDREYHASGNW